VVSGNRRKHAAEVASVLTSTPYKKQLMEKIASKSATIVRTKAAGKITVSCGKVKERGHPFMTSTRRRRGVRMRWTHVDGGVSSFGHPHIKLKLYSCDTILSSSHEKKLTSF